jgi:hypothetical protein
VDSCDIQAEEFRQGRFHLCQVHLL